MQNKLKVYISGKITGNKNYIEQFNQAEDFLKFSGFNPVNPVSVCPFDPQKTWKDYMIEDIKALIECDAIYMLSGWRRSKGAKVEHYIAKKLGLKIIVQDW